MTSGASATNSAACLRISAGLVVAQRVSMRTLRPMLQPTELTLDERLRGGPEDRIVCGCRQQYADEAHAVTLLRVHRERPRNRAADKTDERAPLHGPPKTHSVQALKPTTLRRSGEREMFRPDVRFGS